MLRRLAEKMTGKGTKDNTEEELRDVVAKLKMALEDATAACILEGFQRQDHVMMVDSVLKDLGKNYSNNPLICFIQIRHNPNFVPGRAEAKIAARSRQPTLTSDHFIQQYFLSFAEDPIMNRVKREREEEKESGETENGDHSKR